MLADGSMQPSATHDGPSNGGAGYGSDSRADLSSTNLLIDALQAAGNDANSEAIQRALIFVSRCQNLETEHNTTPFAAKNPDGGFYYTPIGEGGGPAGKTPNGGLRSYGAMTYAGLKSTIFAGVGPDDPRAKTAITWSQEHYDLESNPGLGDAGLYCYYHLFAKALDALGQGEIVNAEGKAHPWRSELIAELASRQQDDGSWVNTNHQWFEGDANLVTGYALLTLASCKPMSPSRKERSGTVCRSLGLRPGFFPARRARLRRFWPNCTTTGKRRPLTV